MSRACCKPWDHRTSQLFPGGRNRCAGSAPSCATLLYADSLQGAAVHVDLAVGEIFLQDDDHRRSLKDSLQTSSGAVVRTVGQTFVTRVLDAEVFSALPNQVLRPRLNVGRLEVPGFAERDIADGAIGADHLPQTGEFGLAIGGARRWGGEVRFAIGGARDAGRATFQPLRLERSHEGSQDEHGREDFHRPEYLLLAPTIHLSIA